MARKRAYRKRADYTKGGRVNYQRGGYGGYEGEGEDYMMNGGTSNIPQAKPQPAKPTTPSYTQADVNQAVADLNTGKITAAQLASQYGVTEDYVKQNLQAINSQAVANKATGLATPPDPITGRPVAPADPVGATKTIQPDADKGETFIPYNTSPYVSVDQTTNVPYASEGDADYEWGAAARGLTEGDQDFITRRDTPETYINGEPEIPEIVLPDPDIDPDPDPDPDPEPEPDPLATAVTDIPADADYTQFEVDQVYDALESGAMTVEQIAAQFGATPAQVQAEWDRMKQVKAGEEVTVEDPFTEGVYEATRKSLLDKKTKEQLDKIDLRKVDDPATEVDESTQRVPGAIVKDYQRVDPDLLVDKREAVGLDVESGVTADADIQKLDAYVDIQPPTGVTTSIMNEAVTNLRTAAEAGEIKAEDYEAYLVNEINNNPQWATSDRSRKVDIDEIRKLTERAEAAEFGTIRPQAMAQVATKDFISDAASVGEVDFRKAVNVSPTKEAEAASREAITGTSQNSDAAKIIDDIGGYEAYKRSEVTGQAAKDAAVDFIAEVGKIQPNLARTIAEDPAKVTEQLDTQEPEVIAAVRELPENALVSTQMQTLMAGIETGEVPVWARPAFDLVNQNMTQRGLDASTVGRDALFNAIIQSALPIAQSNAQALQARASQNLSNEQQAEMARAQLDSTRRMNNLANRQTSESQTAQFAQNINVLQSQFSQERDTLSFQQQQQVRMANLQNTQRTAELNKQAENAFKAQNLANEQQVELAELEIKNQTQQQNMTAENQERLVNMQMAADFLSKNAAFDQQMKLANLSNDQQMELANLTAMNQADSESLSADQQTRLANLNARMQTNLTQGRIAESMGVALLSADQQRAVENASMNARMDLTKFSAEQQIELANSRFMQTVELTDFNARQQAVMQNATALASLDISAVDQRTKLEITLAQNFLQRDMANLSNEQQALILDTQVEQQRLLSSQAAENAARQFGATSDNQMTQFSESLAAQIEQFNSQQHNAMEQFNATEANRMEAMNQANAIDAAKFNNQLNTQIAQFNEQYDLQRDQWNAANAQAIEQSNVQWRRQANTIDTAAVNAANQENAAKSFQISTADQNFIWQALRDEAAYLRQGYENNEQRKTTLYATAISNDIDTGAVGLKPIVDIVDGILD